MLLAIPAAALLLVASAAACGGDDDGGGGDIGGGETAAPKTLQGGGDDGGADASLEEYFTALEDIAYEIETELQSNVDDYNSQTFQSSEEEYAAVQTLLTRTGAAWESSMLQVSRLDPPDRVRDEHEALLKTGTETTRLLSQLLAGVQDAGDMAAANDFIEAHSPDIDEAKAAFDDACSTLQDIADGEAIEVNLRCGDD